ncbi:MAG: hypothetical protein ACR2IS_11120, partial [Nitrososphaeraceae archaeon]
MSYSSRVFSGKKRNIKKRCDNIYTNSQGISNDLKKEMAGFYRVLIRRLINLVIVLFLVLVLTVSLLGETMDKILTDNIRQEVIGSIVDSKIKFQNAKAQQAYVDEQIKMRIKNLGLDEPWFSPKRFLNTIFKVMTLDLGRSYFSTSDSGSPEVIDIIAERVPR